MLSNNPSVRLRVPAWCEKRLDDSGARQQLGRVYLARSALALALFASSFGCSDGGADFTTKVASDFAPARHTVSVLGVYQDGRMSLGSWDTLGPYLTRALGPTQCAVGYDALASSNQDLANAIDEYARDEGPTGNLLTQLAPAALGDLILVVTFAGKLPTRKAGEAGPPTGAPVQNGMTTTRRRGRGHAAAATEARDPNQLDISASLFSVAKNRPVALVGMQYHGESVADALTRFGAELAKAVPELKCTGWNFSVKIDPKLVRPSDDLPAEHPE
jgi:hypothetical protein